MCIVKKTADSVLCLWSVFFIVGPSLRTSEMHEADYGSNMHMHAAGRNIIEIWATDVRMAECM